MLGIEGNRRKKGEGGIFSIFAAFWGGFGSPEGFQGVPGGCGYVVTKFGLKRRHLDLIHAKCHDFAPFQAESRLNPAWIQPIQPGSRGAKADNIRSSSVC